MFAIKLNLNPKAKHDFFFEKYIKALPSKLSWLITDLSRKRPSPTPHRRNVSAELSRSDYRGLQLFTESDSATHSLPCKGVAIVAMSAGTLHAMQGLFYTNFLMPKLLVLVA